MGKRQKRRLTLRRRSPEPPWSPLHSAASRLRWSGSVWRRWWDYRASSDPMSSQSGLHPPSPTGAWKGQKTNNSTDSKSWKWPKKSGVETVSDQFLVYLGATVGQASLNLNVIVIQSLRMEPKRLIHFTLIESDGGVCHKTILSWQKLERRGVEKYNFTLLFF